MCSSGQAARCTRQEYSAPHLNSVATRTHNTYTHKRVHARTNCVSVCLWLTSLSLLLSPSPSFSLLLPHPPSFSVLFPRAPSCSLLLSSFPPAPSCSLLLPPSPFGSLSFSPSPSGPSVIRTVFGQLPYQVMVCGTGRHGHHWVS